MNWWKIYFGVLLVACLITLAIFEGWQAVVLGALIALCVNEIKGKK